MTTDETNVIICSPGLIRMSNEQLQRHVATALNGALRTLPRVAQLQMEAGSGKPNRLVIVVLSDPDNNADQDLITQRLKRLLCPQNLHVSDEDVSVGFV